MAATNSKVNTLIGGSGVDTLYGTQGKDLFVIKSGNDKTLYNIGGEDTISISGTLSEYYGISGDDIKLNFNGGSVNVKNGIGKYLTVIDSKGKSQKVFSDYVKSPQTVIKEFMASLDKTTLQGADALDQAVKSCSNFSSMQDVINNMISDCKNASDVETFLRDKCGIIIDNADIGAVSGWDMGGKTVKTEASVVPEEGTFDNFSGQSFVVNGLTVKLDKNFNDLSDDKKLIWRGLHTWWLKGVLDLIAQSYGDNYSFTSKSSATVKEIDVQFMNDSGTSIAALLESAAVNGQKTDKLTLTINIKNSNPLLESNTNGGSDENSYLDRLIAHEFTHAVMSANINFGVYYQLPSYIREGFAELTIGVENHLRDSLKTLAGDSSKLQKVFATDKIATVEGVGNPTYAGGYMLLKYLAHQAANQSGVTFNTSSKNDIITTGNIKSSINAGAGNDTINVTSSNLTIVGGAGNDLITLSNNGNVIQYGIGDGNDTICNYTEKDTILFNYGTIFQTIESGNDMVINAYNGTITLKDSLDKKISVSGAYYPPGIYNYSNNKKVSGTKNADFINNQGIKATINAGNGADTIYNGFLSSLSAVNGGAGNDLIFVTGGYETVDGGAGNDSIYADISSAYKGRVYKINAGSGNDVVIGYNSTDTVQISDGSGFSTAKSGNDVIISVENASMRLKNAGNTKLNVKGGYYHIDNNENDVTLLGTSGNDYITNTGENVTIQAGKGNDTITGSSNAELFLVGESDGKDLISNFGVKDTLKATSGKIKSTKVSGSNYIVTLKGDESSAIVTLQGAASNVLNVNSSRVFLTNGKRTISSKNKVKLSGSSYADSIISSGSNVTLQAGAGNDTVKVSGQYVTVTGGAGNDLIQNSGSNNVYRFGIGAGNDTIVGYTDNDKLQFLDGTMNNVATIGNDIVVKAYGGSITLKDAADKKLNRFSGYKPNGTYNTKSGAVVKGTSSGEFINNTASKATINGNGGNDTIHNGSKASLSAVNGGAGNDLIFVSGGYETIDGGTGNDSIYADISSAYKGRVYKTKADGGKDVVLGYTANDTVRITDGSPCSTTKSGSDLIVKVGSTAQMTLKNAASKKLNLVGNGKFISNKTQNKTVSGTSNKDSITNNASNVTINAGSSNDTIQTYGNYVSVMGGSGNDSIKSTGGSKVTLYGGAGNDTLTGSSSAEIFQVRADGGKDVITNCGINDSIKSTYGSIKKYSTSGNDYILKFDDPDATGTVTLKNVADNYTVVKSGSIIKLKSKSSSSQMPADDDYWFLEDKSVEESPLNEIVSTDNAVELDEDFENELFKRSTELMLVSARHRQKK